MQNRSHITYKKAGVDIFKADAFKHKIKELAKRSFSAGVLMDIGGFGSLFRFNKKEYKEPVLVSSCDGVGTKLIIAQLMDKHDTVGIDLVAMNVNDILCLGARPLFFLDYIACGRLNPEVLTEIIKGINKGCMSSGCSLIGGETAQMPGMYGPSEYDLAGFCVGVVEKCDIINGSNIKVGDMVIGLESNGLHSNGFSLVRKVLSRNELKRMHRELLRPTRIYVKPLLHLLQTCQANRLAAKITGIAHITGGAFYDKIARILPASLDAVINKGSWRVPAIFRLIQNKAGIGDKEMYHTFNMGIGMVLIVRPEIVNLVRSELSRFDLRSWVIGEIIKGRKEVNII
ncbi:MAG: phosphoribosylformylglycinamidine cyclo-ligase [Candidatus Omnitrophica bacterium]|nr:phosphoribosylformylglycinamidine cyclo-ligase [Candidatus Omnitrophota bacterium]